MLQANETDRVLFLDNVRYLLVLLVVLLHATMGYSRFVPWWCVKDMAGGNAFLDSLLLLLDAFLMPCLFFIAGYFAVPSYVGKGVRPFLVKKVRRLGLPILIVAPLASPLFSYMYLIDRGEPFVSGFVGFWKEYMAGIADVRVQSLDWITHFNHAHLWFMSLLLFFFVIFTLYARFRFSGRGGVNGLVSGSKPGNPIFVFGVVTFLSALSTGVAAFIFPNTSGYTPWLNVGNLLIFQPSKVMTYALYFGMGVHGYNRKWYTLMTIPGPPAIWGLLSVLLATSYLAILKALLVKSSLSLFLSYLVCRPLLCITVLSALTLWAQRHWNSPSRIDRKLAANSYHIYIVHFLVVILMQMLLSGWAGGPLVIKCALAAITAVVLSYGISQYVVRPFPVITVVGVYACFVAILVWVPVPL